jgi:hypothetical protein
MNFDNFIGVTCILGWHNGNLNFAFRYKTWLNKLHALTAGRLYMHNSFMSKYAVAK